MFCLNCDCVLMTSLHWERFYIRPARYREYRDIEFTLYPTLYWEYCYIADCYVEVPPLCVNPRFKIVIISYPRPLPVTLSRDPYPWPYPRPLLLTLDPYPWPATLTLTRDPRFSNAESVVNKQFACFSTCEGSGPYRILISLVDYKLSGPPKLSNGPPNFSRRGPEDPIIWKPGYISANSILSAKKKRNWGCMKWCT